MRLHTVRVVPLDGGNAQRRAVYCEWDLNLAEVIKFHDLQNETSEKKQLLVAL